MPRTPVGTYNRPTPDWYSQNAAYSNGVAIGGGGGGGSVSLFNDSNQGEYLWLYYMRADVSGDQGLYAQSAEGVTGSLYQGSYPLIAGLPTPRGSIYAGATPAGADLIHVPISWQQTDGFSAPFETGAPMVGLPPGFSFIVYNGFAACVLTVNFMWVVLPSTT